MPALVCPLTPFAWLTEAGTKGLETVVTVELEPSGDGTRIRLTHAGFADETMRDGHEEGWREALSRNLEEAFGQQQPA